MSVAFLGLLGLIAGGPVFVGTLIVRLWTSQITAVLLLALAGGALVYVIEELFRTSLTRAAKAPVFVSVAVGFFAGLGTELVIAIASARSASGVESPSCRRSLLTQRSREQASRMHGRSDLFFFECVT